MKAIDLKYLTTHWLGFAVRAANNDVPATTFFGASRLQTRGRWTKFVDRHHSFVVKATVQQLRAELEMRMRSQFNWPIDCPYFELAAARAAAYGGKLDFDTYEEGRIAVLHRCNGTYFGSGHYTAGSATYGLQEIPWGEEDNGFCLVKFQLALMAPGGIAVQRHNSGNRTIYYCAE